MPAPVRAKTPSKMKVELVAIDTLLPHPQNPRVGNVDQIATSLEANDQYKPIIVQKSTRYVLAGNHTMLAAKSLGWDNIEVIFADVDDTQATRILLADNRTADLGTYDNTTLAEILEAMPTLEGTGYTAPDLDDILAGLNDQGGKGGNKGEDWQPGNPVVSTTIIFDDVEQQAQWNRFVVWLKGKYPDAETVAERITSYVADVLTPTAVTAESGD